MLLPERGGAVSWLKTANSARLTDDDAWWGVMLPKSRNYSPRFATKTAPKGFRRSRQRLNAKKYQESVLRWVSNAHFKSCPRMMLFEGHMARPALWSRPKLHHVTLGPIWSQRNPSLVGPEYKRLQSTATFGPILEPLFRKTWCKIWWHSRIAPLKRRSCSARAPLKRTSCQFQKRWEKLAPFWLQLL